MTSKKHTFERKLIDTVMEVSKEASKSDWDGYGGLPITDETVNCAIRFIVLLPQWIPEPDIAPEPDDSIGFDWMNQKGQMFSISVDKNMNLCYAGLNGENKISGNEKMGDIFPKHMADFIKEIYNL